MRIYDCVSVFDRDRFLIGRSREEAPYKSEERREEGHILLALGDIADSCGTILVKHFSIGEKNQKKSAHFFVKNSKK